VSITLTYSNPDLTREYAREVPDGTEGDALTAQIVSLASSAHAQDPAGVHPEPQQLREAALAYTTTRPTPHGA
jgi:hypothetical protein